MNHLGLPYLTLAVYILIPKKEAPLRCEGRRDVWLGTVWEPWHFHMKSKQRHKLIQYLIKVFSGEHSLIQTDQMPAVGFVSGTFNKKKYSKWQRITFWILKGRGNFPPILGNKAICGKKQPAQEIVAFLKSHSITSWG